MISDAYERAAEIIGPARAESIKVAEVVERLRSDWRPPRVRVVLLAESHVWTSPDEAARRVRQPDGVETGFARFVYCLGYGEPELVVPSGVSEKRGGTPQYWRLFHDAVCEPVASAAELWPRNAADRVLAKLQLLNELKLAGIWLVDASVTALYQPGRKKLVTGSKYKRLLQACWEAHVGGVIDGCSASAILIVGQGVDDAIGDLVRQAAHQAKVAVVNQPNARLTREEIRNDRRTVFDLCHRHGLWDSPSAPASA